MHMHTHTPTMHTHKHTPLTHTHTTHKKAEGLLTRKCMHTHVCTRTHTHTAHTSCTCTCTHTYTHTHTHSHTHTLTPAHTSCTHTHTNTHTPQKGRFKLGIAMNKPTWTMQSMQEKPVHLFHSYPLGLLPSIYQTNKKTPPKTKNFTLHPPTENKQQMDMLSWIKSCLKTHTLKQGWLLHF